MPNTNDNDNGIQIDEQGRRFVYATPTWTSIIDIYIEAIRRGNTPGSQAAETEIKRLASIVDNLHEQMKTECEAAYDRGFQQGQQSKETEEKFNMKQLIERDG